MAKILYLITEDWFFCSHFIERATAAAVKGHDVVVVARESRHAAQIRSAGLRFQPLDIRRQGINPFSELLTVCKIWNIYRSERPDVLHHVALKSIVYGSFCAQVLRISGVVNAPVGMGFVFSSKTRLARLLKPLVSIGLKLFLSSKKGRVVFENNDDLNEFVTSGAVARANARLIRGAGVDLKRFAPQPEPLGVPMVVLTARMLWDKGVSEFVDAATLLRARGIIAQFVLVGDSDSKNPAAICEEQLSKWTATGAVQWLKHQNDIPSILAAAHIICLPSYREGLPKSLIEALAAGRPVVTTDVPGCREVVRHGFNGYLVPPRDAESLADYLQILLKDKQLRIKFGTRGRKRAELEFGSKKVIRETLAVYAELAGQRVN